MTVILNGNLFFPLLYSITVLLLYWDVTSFKTCTRFVIEVSGEYLLEGSSYFEGNFIGRLGLGEGRSFTVYGQGRLY